MAPISCQRATALRRPSSVLEASRNINYCQAENITHRKDEQMAIEGGRVAGPFPDEFNR